MTKKGVPESYVQEQPWQEILQLEKAQVQTLAAQKGCDWPQLLGGL